MNINFSNQTCIITGGSSGLGKTICLQFLKLGASVFITWTKDDAPEWTKAYKRCNYIKVNFLDKSSLDNFINCIKKIDKIDVLINNAGIIKFDEIGTKEFADGFMDVLNVNLFSAIQITNETVINMKKNKYGRIINVSSVSGHIVKPNQSSYASTKQGLNGFTKGIAIDLARYNILANSICPSTINTPMTKNKLSEKQINLLYGSHPLKRLASTSDISNVITFLSSSNNTYYTGQSLIVDGGLSLN